MNTVNFTIDAKDIEYAQDACKYISSPDVRNRAVANSLAANIAEKFFDKDNFSVDTESGLHNISIVLEDINIADIYVNNFYIDVRVYFHDSEMRIPKEHFTNNIVPSAYMFIKLDNDLFSGTVTGFLSPNNISNVQDEEGDYIVEPSQLTALDEIELVEINSSDDTTITDKQIFDYIDNKLLDKSRFFQGLILSRSARIKLAKAVKAQYIFNLISVPQKETENSENSPDNRALDVLLDVDNETSEDLNNYDFSTVTSPSIENQEAVTELNERILESADEIAQQELLSQSVDVDKNEQSIDSLFDNNKDNNSEDSTTFMSSENSDYDENFIPPKKSRLPLLVAFVLIFIAISGIGVYFAITQFNLNNSQADADNLNQIQAPPIKPTSDSVDANQVAMPLETVEAITPVNAEEANVVSIPAIEQNLNASILVSKLKVEWEVPKGYASNTSAQRYLVKLGKIIQLNLKTELLLLSKPPITNKIAVEIKYDNNEKKFQTVGISISSGEKSVDDLILQTVNRALNMKLNINSDSFAKLQGNPVLIIHL